MVDDAATDPLSQATMIYVAPRTGTSGVSDYADDILRIAHDTFGKVIEVRCDGAGAASAADVRAGLKEVREAIASTTGPVIVHTEASGGALLPYWALTLKEARKNPRVALSATLHDAPTAVTTPFRTRGISKNRILNHAVHYPVLPLLLNHERKTLGPVKVSALTKSGAEAIEKEQRHDPVTVSFLPPPIKDDIVPAAERPLAVGLFGYVYRGKGFDSLAELRELVDPSIEIRVAGRGTEQLDPIEGVTIVGPVEGPDEDAFFSSIRAIAMPYSKRNSYGPTTHVASSVLARAIAYGTPVIALKYPGLGDEAIAVNGGLPELATTVNTIIPDDAAVAQAAAHALQLRDELTVEAAFNRLAQGWREALPAAE